MKMKETCFPGGVQLGWIIDSINKMVYGFRQTGMALLDIKNMPGGS
jgi:Uma2 family endonuclease